MLKDPGVWSILDEGCNTTCHSKAWRLNAQEKLLNKGFTLEICEANKTSNGVGANARRASMMFRVPFAIEVGPCHKSLYGVIESYELETGEDRFVPMLICLFVQPVDNGTGERYASRHGYSQGLRHGDRVLHQHSRHT